MLASHIANTTPRPPRDELSAALVLIGAGLLGLVVMGVWL